MPCGHRALLLQQVTWNALAFAPSHAAQARKPWPSLESLAVPMVHDILPVLGTHSGRLIAGATIPTQGAHSHCVGQPSNN